MMNFHLQTSNKSVSRITIGEKLLLLLAPFGRMGLGLYQYCGSTLTLVIALISLAMQIKLSSLWLQKHSQGPLNIYGEN
ncbi:DUF418 domain-containing protein [Thalassotalea sp. ND16A]|uniref:DUF418 domain-containing protein n=1 Tax=Thalassotalea sp. ND16A TaxID=1535422 RepID=UPI00051A4940|nr:DUF418 domain-containing protein [Thalassotalea sp. ND16A]KGJ95817.1 hypothetical protein ND16A_1352 [Thalassotalea sp. ND16A]